MKCSQTFHTLFMLLFKRLKSYEGLALGTWVFYKQMDLKMLIWTFFLQCCFIFIKKTNINELPLCHHSLLLFSLSQFPSSRGELTAQYHISHSKVQIYLSQDPYTCRAKNNHTILHSEVTAKPILLSLHTLTVYFQRKHKYTKWYAEHSGWLRPGRPKAQSRWKAGIPRDPCT